MGADCPRTRVNASARRANSSTVASEGAGPKEHACVSKHRLTNESDHSGPLVLIDSGATLETAPFPDDWNGVPPPEAKPITMGLAVGNMPGFRLGGTVYFHPDEGNIDPVFPWGRFSRKWHLEVT